MAIQQRNGMGERGSGVRWLRPFHIALILFLSILPALTYGQAGGQILFAGLEADGLGAAAWNADGSGPEAANTGHTVGWTTCVPNAVYYLASRDFGGIDPAAAGGIRGAQGLGGFAGFASALAANGFTVEDLTMSWGLQTLGSDTEGLDWWFDAGTSVETRTYTGGTFTIRLGGEDLVGGPMPATTVIVSYNDVANCTDDQISGFTASIAPEDRSASSSAAVQAVAAAFLNDVGSEGIKFVFDSFQPAGQQPQFTANGRQGAYFELQSGRIEIGPLPATPFSWGQNHYGQLGDGTTDSRGVAVQVGGLIDVEAVATGTNHALAVKGDGTVWGWGYDSHSQLAVWPSGPPHPPGLVVTTPQQVRSPTGADPALYLDGVKAVDAGVQWSVALKHDGTVWTWGRSELRQLGRLFHSSSQGRGPAAYPGKVETNPDPNGPLTFLTDVVAIAAGGYHGLALQADGAVWAWGHNTLGQLGDGTRYSRRYAVRVKDPNDPSGLLTGVTAIDAGNHHSLAVKSDGTVWAWGNNAEGQLGYGSLFVPTHNFSLLPVQVKDPNDPSGFLTGVEQVGAGWKHSIALKSGSRTVLAWGFNDFGWLGDGTNTQRFTPVQVLGPGGTGVLDDVVDIDAGINHNLAVRSDGSVWAWGLNAEGQLGDGCTVAVDCADRSTPVQVSGVGRIRLVSAGRQFSMAISANDGDGIAADVDLDSVNYSNAFRNGNTEGSITDRGDQDLTVTASNGGIRIEASAGGGPDPAVVTACGGTVEVELNAGGVATITCTSATVRADAVSLPVTFLVNTWPQARLTLQPGHTITFDEKAMTLTAHKANPFRLTVLTELKRLAIKPGTRVEIVKCPPAPRLSPQIVDPKRRQ